MAWPLESTSPIAGVPSRKQAPPVTPANLMAMKKWPAAPFRPITTPVRSAAWQGGVPGGSGTGPCAGEGGTRLGDSGVQGTTPGIGPDEPGSGGTECGELSHAASRIKRDSASIALAITGEYVSNG